MRCPDCDTLMLKEYCDGGYVWRCYVCVKMLPLYEPEKTDPLFMYREAANKLKDQWRKNV